MYSTSAAELIQPSFRQLTFPLLPYCVLVEYLYSIGILQIGIAYRSSLVLGLIYAQYRDRFRGKFLVHSSAGRGWQGHACGSGRAGRGQHTCVVSAGDCVERRSRSGQPGLSSVWLSQTLPSPPGPSLPVFLQVFIKTDQPPKSKPKINRLLRHMTLSVRRLYVL